MPCNFLRNLRGKAASSIEAENLTEVTVPFTYTAKKSPALYTEVKGLGFLFSILWHTKSGKHFPKITKLVRYTPEKQSKSFSIFLVEEATKFVKKITVMTWWVVSREVIKTETELPIMVNYKTRSHWKWNSIFPGHPPPSLKVCPGFGQTRENKHPPAQHEGWMVWSQKTLSH